MLPADFAIRFPVTQEHGQFTTFRMCTMHGLGPASPPVALSSTSGEMGTPEPATYLVGQASQHLWLVIDHDVYQRFTFVDHTMLALAPNRLMLAVVISPHGSMTVLADAATLSQAHLIQRGLGTGGRTPGKSLLS